LAINLVSLLDLGGLHFHFNSRRERQNQTTDFDERSGFGFSPEWCFDPGEARSQELPKEHDGSPIYVGGKALYLKGGAIIEEVFDLSYFGLGPVRFCTEVFHKHGQVYYKLRSLDTKIECSAFGRITDQLIPGFTQRLSGVEKTSLRPLRIAASLQFGPPSS